MNREEQKQERLLLAGLLREYAEQANHERSAVLVQEVPKATVRALKRAWYQAREPIPLYIEPCSIGVWLVPSETSGSGALKIRKWSAEDFQSTGSGKDIYRKPHGSFLEHTSRRRRRRLLRSGIQWVPRSTSLDSSLLEPHDWSEQAELVLAEREPIKRGKTARALAKWYLEQEQAARLERERMRRSPASIPARAPALKSERARAAWRKRYERAHEQERQEAQERHARLVSKWGLDI